MAKYTIGVDFGTLSGRAVLVSVADGAEIADATFDYPHGVMDERLADGTPLGIDWALQDPQDYLDVFTHTIPAVMKKSGVAAEDVIGIGVDFTACTVMPVKKDGTPLCFLPEYKSEPHAYPKLWKHHAAQEEANRLNDLAVRRGEKWIRRYGGKISSEWEVPKIMQLVNEAPDVYDAIDYWIEGGDWVVFALTGVLSKNSCAAGYKGIWNKDEGYPSSDFFRALHPKLANYVSEKLDFPIVEPGTRVGGLTEPMAAELGLKPGTAVAAAIIDAHVAVPAVKITGGGQMLAIMGTSTCHMVVSERESMIEGICGVVDGGIYPGFFGYEAGQSCVGDHFAWFVENCCPPEYFERAKAAGLPIQSYLSALAEKLAVGESGLLALDWWNGNRSVLVDFDLTGMMIGMTLLTKPEEIYRALIEATAFGTRMIVEAFNQGGVAIRDFFASGGISQKNPLAMQIYADVLNLPVRIAGSLQGPALGAAIFGSVAAGKESGGYATIFEAAGRMGKLRDVVYEPVPENVAAYEALYRDYKTLHDYFGRGANDVMKRLKSGRVAIKERK